MVYPRYYHRVECPDPDVLNALASGGMSSEQRIAIANHASTCAACHAAIDALLVSRDGEVVESLAITLGIDRAKAETLPEPIAARSRPRPLAAGDMVDRYVIEAALGAGGMGVVYRARDPELGRAVAIKVLRQGLGGERLRREAQALARLSHPNVVAVYDVGTHGGLPFIAMALVEGDDLRQWLRTARDRQAVLDVLVAAGHGIAAAHDVGLIHRDLKPDNIFVANTGQVLVGDFGLARGVDSVERATTAGVSASEVDTPSDLTRSGTVLGTPAYMAPEQAAGGATIWSDQFSFCVMAWEAFTQVRPFAGATTGEILDNMRAQTIVEPTGDHALPSRIGAALRRGLQVDPALRFASMTALLGALEPRRRARWIVAGTAGAAIAALAATIVITQRPSASPQADPVAAVSCGGEDRMLDGAWTPVRRAEVERALSRRPGSEITTKRTLAMLDHSAGAWIAARRAACATARTAADRRVYDQQVECFDAARRELELVVETLSAATGPGSSDAIEFVENTPPVERCSNPAALVHVAPPDPDRRAGVDRVRAGLVRNRVAGQLRVGDAWPVLQKLRGDAEAIGYLPLVGEVARAEATQAYARDDYAAAETAARRALAIADQLRDDLSRAHVAALLGWILTRQGKFEAAAEQIAAAEAAWARAGKDPRIEVEILTARADVARIQHQPDRVAATERLVDRVRQVYGPTSIRLAKSLMTLLPMYASDQQELSQRAAREASEIWALQAGSLDQAVMTAIGKVDEAKQAGDLRLAIQKQLEVIAVVAAAAPGGADEAIVLQELGSYYELATRWDDAAQAYQRALDIYQRGASSDRQVMFDAMAALGRMRLESGNAVAAVTLLELARGMITRTLPANRDDASILLVGLGRAYAASNRNADAIAVLEPLVEPLRKAVPPRSMRFGLVCSTLATALWSAGGARDRDRARALASDARTAWKATAVELGADPMRVDQQRLLVERQQALAEWVASHP